MGLKDLFVKPVESVGGAAGSPSQRPVSATANPFRPTVSSAPPPPTRTPLLGGAPAPAKAPASRASRAPDQHFLHMLDTALSEAKSPGYEQLLGQLRVLEPLIQDRNKLIQAVVKSVTELLGITPQQLVSAIEERIHILERERSEIEAQLAREAQEKVAGNQSAAEEADRRTNTIDAQITRLQQERASAQQSAEIARRAIESVQGEVSEVNERFSSAYNHRVEELAHMLDDLRGTISA